MSVTYKCDVCKKKTDELIMLMGGFLRKSPFRHICYSCWHKIEKYIKEKLVKFKSSGI